MRAGQELQGFLRMRLVQLGALALLFAILGGISMVTVHSVQDPDVWWHLRVGDWIRQNFQVPHDGIFSRTAAGHPWVAYSWGYEVQLSLFYAAFGLIGIALNGLILTMFVLIATFWSMYRLSRNFWASIVLTGIGCYSFVFALMPRPVFFSMMLLAVLITLLLESQRTGRVRALYWLPAVFCLWANLHIQFVYGLFVLGLFGAIRTCQQLLEARRGKFAWIESSSTLPLLQLWAIFLGCILAGCIGPYGPRLYYVVLEYSRSKYTYSMIIELFAPLFENTYEYFELFVAAAAFFALGWRRRIDLFKAVLLTIAAITAFRTQRDGWFLSLVALAVIADTLRDDERTDTVLPLRVHGFAVVGAMVCACLFLVGENTDFTPRDLDRTAAAIYPTNAANFIRRNYLPGPMFNSFDWGGFLIWYMPQYPVSIDGRNDLYGDALDKRLYDVEGGELPYNKEPFFTESRLILLEPNVPLARLLSVDPAYETAYRDGVAVVFVRRAGFEAPQPY